MSQIKRFLRQSSHYSIGQVLILFASLISFPILTRIFTLEEYGIMNLISNTVLILVAVSKGGLQHSVVRSYHEYSQSDNTEHLSRYISSILISGLAIAIIITVLGILISSQALASWFSDIANARLLVLSGGLIFLRASESILLAFLRAEQKTVMLNGYRVVVRYLNLIFILGILFLVSRNLTGFYAAQLLAMTLAISVLFSLRLKRNPIRLKYFSSGILRQALVYGFPLVGFELASMFLNYIDRYIIQFHLSTEAVGLYSAAYNLIDYIKDIVVLPLASAVMPIYMKTWTEKGSKVTSRFLVNAFKSYALLGVPIIFGCAATGENLIHFIASEKFVSAHVIIPWIVAGFIINGALPILGASLYLQKKTNILAGMLALVTILNAGMNHFIIPMLGIKGAAIAKLVSYIVLIVAVTAITYRFMEFRIPWKELTRYVAAGSGMYLAIGRINLADPTAELFASIAVGIVVYFLLVVTLDHTFRKSLTSLLQKLA